MRCLVVASCLLCLLQSAHAAFNNGALIPPGTAAGQDLLWSTTANNMMGGWVPSSSILSNGSQVAIGGSVDSTSRLSVNPSGTSENGITVNMPSGATGRPFQAKNSTGSVLFYFDSLGNFNTPGGGLGSGYAVSAYNSSVFTSQQRIALSQISGTPALVFGNTDTEIIRTAAGTLTVQGDNVYGGVAGTTLIVKALSSQASDLLDFNTSTNATSAKVDKNYNAQFAGYSQAVRSVSTTDTATLSDSYLRLTAAVAETLPTTSVPTGRTFTVLSTVSGASLTNTVNGTAGYTFSAPYKFITVIYNGSSYDLIGGN